MECLRAQIQQVCRRLKLRDKVARVGWVDPPLVEARTRGLLVEKKSRVSHL